MRRSRHPLASSPTPGVWTLPRIRATPDDFEVEEIPLERPSGTGSHTWLSIEKRERNTADVARELAAALGVEEREVGWAGRKDRRAVTRQWLSVAGVEPERALAVALDGVRILAAERHPTRLRPGDLAGNRFRLVVRDVDAATAERATARLDEMARRGVPNRFGEQRFGRGPAGEAGSNAARGAAILAGERLSMPKRDALFLVSAFQAALFNEVLDARPVPLDALLAGDLVVDGRTGLLRSVVDPAAEAERVARFEVSATGPILGTKMRRATGAAGEIETAVFARHGIDPRRFEPPRGIRLFGERRPLRTPVREVESAWEGEALRLAFTLGPGSYATVVLGELFDEIVEGPA